MTAELGRGRNVSVNDRVRLPATRPAVPPIEPSPSGDDGLVEVIVHLTQRAHAALEDAAASTRDTQTDTVNRALVTYDLIQKAIRSGGGAVTLVDKDGRPRRIRVS